MAIASNSNMTLQTKVEHKPGDSIAAIILFMLSLVSLFIHAISFNNFSVLVTFSILYITGTIFFFRSGRTVLLFYHFAFLINVVLSVMFVFYFNNLRGMPFTEGGDDRTFYMLSKAWSYGIDSFNAYAQEHYGISWNSINYKFYIIILGSWFKFLRSLSFEQDHFFNLNIINCWFGGLIAPFVCKIGKEVFSKRVAKLTALLILFYAPIIFYSVVIIRDTLIGVLFLIIVWHVVRNGNKWARLVLIALIFFILYYLRPTSAFFAFLFVLTFWASGSRLIQVKAFFRRYTILIALTMISFSSLLVMTEMAVLKGVGFPIIEKVIRYFEFYRGHSLAEASSGSIGSILKQSNNPLIFILLIFYTYLSPIPPEIIQSFSLKNLFILTGNMTWYVAAPTFLVCQVQYLKNKTYSNLLYATIITLFMALVFVSMTTGNPRHLYFLHPIIAMFVLSYILDYPRQFNYLLQVLVIIGLIGSGVYLAIKIL